MLRALDWQKYKRSRVCLFLRSGEIHFDLYSVLDCDTPYNKDCVSVVSESSFFNLETRMRVSPIQSRSSRRDREFLTLTLRLRDETEKKFPPISGIETRSRFIIFTLRLRDENENSLDLISFFETRPRILKLAIFPWNQAWTASLFCMQFLGG